MKNLIFFSAFVWIVACSPKSLPDSNWEGKRWVVIELNGAPVQTSGTDQDAHLQFNAVEKMVTGSGGCNRIFGPYQIEKNQILSFGNLGSSMMACEDLRFEDTFLEAIRAVQGFEEAGSELLLKDEKGKVIIVLK